MNTLPRYRTWVLEWTNARYRTWDQHPTSLSDLGSGVDEHPTSLSDLGSGADEHHRMNTLPRYRTWVLERTNARYRTWDEHPTSLSDLGPTLHLAIGPGTNTLPRYRTWDKHPTSLSDLGRTPYLAIGPGIWSGLAKTLLYLYYCCIVGCVFLFGFFSLFHCSTKRLLWKRFFPWACWPHVLNHVTPVLFGSSHCLSFCKFFWYGSGCNNATCPASLNPNCELNCACR